MPTLIIYIALTIIVIGGVVQNRRILTGEKDGIPPGPTTSPTETATPTTSQTPPTSIPTRTSTPVPTQSRGDTNQNIDPFLYPGSVIVSSNSNSMQLTSTQDADVITDWYKEKIKSMGYRSTAFAATKTNGNVLTKLAGANGNTQINIEITKPSGDNTTKITITINTY